MHYRVLCRPASDCPAGCGWTLPRTGAVSEISKGLAGKPVGKIGYAYESDVPTSGTTRHKLQCRSNTSGERPSGAVLAEIRVADRKRIPA